MKGIKGRKEARMKGIKGRKQGREKKLLKKGGKKNFYAG